MDYEPAYSVTELQDIPADAILLCGGVHSAISCGAAVLYSIKEPAAADGPEEIKVFIRFLR